MLTKHVLQLSTIPYTICEHRYVVLPLSTPSSILLTHNPALVYWDYVLTLRNEIQYMWTKQSVHRLSTLLYICCRYALLANILYLLAISNKLGSSCNTWYKFIGGISVVGRAAVLSE